METEILLLKCPQKTVHHNDSSGRSGFLTLISSYPNI